MGASLAANIVAAGRRHGDRPAVKLDDFTMTYAQLAGASAHVAGLLAAEGVGPGDRVGLMVPNVPQFPTCYYGILRLGGVVVPMNVLLKEREVAYYLEDSGAPRWCSTRRAPRAARRAPSSPTTTSASTRRPHAVCTTAGPRT